MKPFKLAFVLFSFLLSVAAARPALAGPEVRLAGFEGTTQYTSNWCWAAITQMAYVTLKQPAQVPAQCTIASTVLGYSCCQNPFSSQCDKGYVTEEALKKVTLLTQAKNPAVSEIVNAINKQQVPVLKLMKPDNSMRHVVIAYGYNRNSDGTYSVYVWDPGYYQNEIRLEADELASRRFYNDWIWYSTVIARKK